ncbi:uncharacterized protein LOC113295876 isoform X1 [Papaver somniferum]|uniref:uncharacterized protein LOC113295876 isoform X1 n=1 Tax=Papaver somniferum TaxID=3469 RepID=UPI000E700985|nr:uncharacterized protein LOC113295876 isoform X1 [Papaver somniferum]XP_026399990.1 uncharacterized protein LOC113295876 isoform X1 [Papaver somniferum]XP_026399991.1 uncharacterized protein LOC113295876 isoform X1 [Papaver somniferum]XP_026399992.1 uncharacterized protein LOC113295876 isoform X1 [Papaver somniferum]XP_026399993.1 uncharacterized protein LOC113295876 isoform X1 [Papaver somniferum]XP_026399994.1 uncharacterized protein LOC113295876 isoform X1 [Papaver somniferum]
MLKRITGMGRLSVYNVILLYVCGFVIGAVSLDQEKMADSKVLNVGEELLRETLPLQMGSRLYRLNGLKSSTWYEVKISYPASIPASFSIQLIRDKSDIGHNWNRRLLNTEKLIFEADSNDIPNHQSFDQSQKYVLVSVEPAGVVAIPGVKERELVLFNIVCDELLLGIPHKAIWVGVLVVICLGVACIVPSFLPPYLLVRKQKS